MKRIREYIHSSLNSSFLLGVIVDHLKLSRDREELQYCGASASTSPKPPGMKEMKAKKANEADGADWISDVRAARCLWPRL